MMRASILALVVALALTGCSTLDKSAAPTCDGRHLRPANPHGSVLDPAAPATSPAAGPAKASAVSALAASYRNCA